MCVCGGGVGGNFFKRFEKGGGELLEKAWGKVLGQLPLLFAEGEVGLAFLSPFLHGLGRETFPHEGEHFHVVVGKEAGGLAVGLGPVRFGDVFVAVCQRITRLARGEPVLPWWLQ